MDASERARALRGLLATFIALTGLIAVIAALDGSYRRAGISVLGGAVYGLLLLGLRRWGARRTGLLCTLWYFVIATAAITVGRGVHDVAMILFPAGIFLGALFLRRVHVVALLAVSVLIVAAVGVGKAARWLPVRPELPAGYTDVAVAALLLLVSGVLAQFAVTSLRAVIEERLRTGEALRQSQGEVEARNRALQLVNGLVHRLHRTLDVDAIARETVDALVELGRPPLVAFYLLEGDGTRVRLAAQHGFTEAERALGASLPVAGSLTGFAILEKKLVTTDDLLADGRSHRGIAEALARRGISAAMAIPLVFEGDALGTMNLIFEERPSFGAIEMDTFEAIGQAVSLAIANARHLATLDYQAFHDSLTHLPNRAGLHREFVRAAPPSSDRRIGLVLLDLDRFREINEALGHHVGDELLLLIGSRLAACHPGGRGATFRLGGDEFAVLFPDIAAAEDAERGAHRLLAAIKSQFALGGMALEIRASAGVAVFPDHGGDSHELLRCADVALEHSKRTGTAPTVYDPAFDVHTPARLALVSELGLALREGGLELRFQPTVALPSRAVVGFEALIRWRHPRLGLLDPPAFLPYAESTDVIHPLTRWVVENALGELLRWEQAGFRPDLAINLSVRNLLDRRCPDEIEEILARSGVAPGRIEFELTETALMSDPEAASGTLGRLTATGARLAIDDFGTGYSSLAHLKRLPVHTLKIDRSFVSDMLAGEQSLALVRSTVQMGRALGLRVVAEGVEDDRTAAALAEMGCELAQGFLFGVPLPADEVGHRLATGAWTVRPDRAT